MRVAPIGHRSVLLEETLAGLVTRPDGTYVDGTFGGGGHANALLDRYPAARVIAFDRDPEAIARAEAMRARLGQHRLIPRQANFAEMADELPRLGITAVDGVLLDLGLSSFQLDSPERGFAIRLEGPLDMRFDPSSGQSAADVIDHVSESELAHLIWRYGEERRSRQIARAIVQERARHPIETTGQLAGIVERAIGRRKGSPGHPAVRTFQALRITVNAEFEALEHALQAAVNVLRPGGRLAVIAFHSLEDRIVKQFIARESATCVCPPEQVICTCDTRPTMKRIGGARKPSQGEIDENPRARSAVLRVAERIDTTITGDLEA
jgi:16S rRNA (cytosine1402-N4)-methyltransferase